MKPFKNNLKKSQIHGENQQVILINYTGRRGGGPLAAYEMTKALIEQGLFVVAVISDAIENLESWKQLPLKKLVVIPTYHSPLTFIYRHAWFLLFRKYTIRKYLKDYEIKVIYCPMCTFWTYAVNQLFPDAKKIVACHDPVPHTGEAHPLLDWFCGIEKAYRSADELIVHSRKFVRYTQNRYKKKGHVHYLPLGRPDFYKQISEKYTAVSYRPDTVNFVFFGRISPYKGLDLLAEAYRMVSAKCSRVTLTVAGAGDFAPYKKKYQSLSHTRVINRWIRDDEVESIFTGNNLIAVLPYTDATQSGVALVAMNYGVPVIAADAGGLSEQIEDGVTGMLIQPGSAGMLAEKMLLLARDRQLYEEIRNQIRHRTQRMQWDKPAKKLAELAGKIC